MGRQTLPVVLVVLVDDGWALDGERALKCAWDSIRHQANNYAGHTTCCLPGQAADSILGTGSGPKSDGPLKETQTHTVS